MARPVADDIIAVLETIKSRSANSQVRPIHEIRRDAVQSIAQRELDASRFANMISAQNSIQDACVRRLGYSDVSEFDYQVDNWLRGQPDSLTAAVLAKTTTSAQREKVAEVLSNFGVGLWTSDSDIEYFEGAVIFRLHREKERNRKVVVRKKEMIIAAEGKLICEVCDFDFADVYGSLGKGFAECHHRVPLAELHQEYRIEPKDLAIVCANCHRMLHATPAHTVEALRQVIQARRSRGTNCGA